MTIDITRLNQISEMYSGFGAYNPSEKLSANFTLGEFTKSSTAASQGIDNTPSDAVIAKLRTLAGKIQKIRDDTGPISITSGYRSQALQAALQKAGNKNAVEYSAHTYGEAADIAPASGNKYAGNIKGFYAYIVTRKDLLSLFGAVVILADKGILHIELPSTDKLGVPMYEGTDGQYYRFKTTDALNSYISDAMESVSTFVSQNKAASGFGLVAILAGLGALGTFLFLKFKKKS